MKNTTVTGILLIGSAVIVNLAFTLLGSAFDYPDILQRPAAEVLGRFAENPVAIGGIFALLAAGAALLGPIAVRIAHQAAAGRIGTAAAVTGISAAIVQTVGLLRWPLIVPALASATEHGDAGERADAAAAFATVNTVLGQVVGETLGYLLTTAWTVLVVIALVRSGFIGRSLATLGTVSAALIATGVLIPLDVPGTEPANFVGYIVWSVWLVLVGVVFIRRPRVPSVEAAAAPVAVA